MAKLYKAFSVSIVFLLLSAFLCPTPCFAVKDDPISRTVFFGDSTTAHLVARGGIPASRVWSGAGNTVLFETVNRTKCVHLAEENLDLSLADAVARGKPEILVITLGVSGGAGFLSREAFLAVYREMLDSVRTASPATKIVVQSILPLSDRSVKHYKRLNKDAVVEANSWIHALCDEMGILYVDTHARLVDDDNGYLKVIYQNDEYMHLTKAAYAVVIETIREALLRDAARS